jgi:hypothetical protein
MRLAFASLLVAASAAACVTPELPTPPEPVEQPDAMVIPPPDARTDCEAKHATVGTGYHNPGLECLSCHNGQQAGAPIFTLGGTAYKDLAGTQPLVGATVVVIDGNGTVLKMPTQQNGNFYSSAALQAPYLTFISQCPDNVQMIANFTDGDCNTCHDGQGEIGRVVFRP